MSSQTLFSFNFIEHIYLDIGSELVLESLWEVGDDEPEVRLRVVIGTIEDLEHVHVFGATPP